MFSKINVLSNIFGMKRKQKKEEQEHFSVFNLIDDIDEQKISKTNDKLSPEYALTLFDEVINIIMEKKYGAQTANSFQKFVRKDKRYFSKKEIKGIEKYLINYFKKRGNILYKNNKTYNKLNCIFGDKLVYYTKDMYTFNSFMEWGKEYLDKIANARKQSINLPLPSLNIEEEITDKNEEYKFKTPVMKEIHSLNTNKVTVEEVQEQPKKVRKPKKELTNIEILYKNYRKVNNKIKKLIIEINDEDNKNNKISKQNLLNSYIELSHNFEEMIYNYKKLNSNYQDAIDNSYNIRKQNALKSVTRYIRSKNNNVTLDNLEEHFSKDQLNYFNELGINVEEIVLNNSKTKRIK